MGEGSSTDISSTHAFLRRGPGLSRPAWGAGDTAVMETAVSLHCPSLGRSGEGLPSPHHCCHQPAVPRAALAITPWAAGEAGQKQPLCLPPYYRAQVTSLLGSRNKAKPPQPLAWLSGLERSDERSPAAATLLPADSHGSGWVPGR